MYIEINSKKTRISEAFAIAAMIVLSIDTANTFVGQGGYGFLSPLNDQQSGILLGIPSIILFFVSFGFGFREKTRLTSLLLVAGGALLAVSKIVEPTMGLNLFLAVALRPLYIGLILMGFVIMGLGAAKMFQENKQAKHYKRLSEEGKNAENGPIVVNLFIPAKATGKVTGSLAQSRIKSTSLIGPLKGKQMPDLISLMKNGQAYVIVRTAQNPPGEVRGTITVG
jgi:hypothetical protein